MAVSKKAIQEMVRVQDFPTLLEAFDENPSFVRRALTRLSFNPDDPLHESVMDAFTYLSHERQEGFDLFWRETMRRQLWAMNEEGANNAWSAPELIGSVIAGNPSAYKSFFSFAFMAAVEELTFQPSLIRAYDRLRAIDPSVVEDFSESIEALRRLRSA